MQAAPEQGKTFDLSRSAEQLITPDPMRRTASFFTQTLRSRMGSDQSDILD